MADDQKGPEAAIARSKGEDTTQNDRGRSEEALDSTDWSSPANLWQVPAILISALLIALGLYVASHQAPRNDFDGVLDQIDQLITDGELDVARARLREVVEPNLAEAGPDQQARYHLAVGDWIAVSQEGTGLSLPATNSAIDEAYSRAQDLGAVFAPARLERWAAALIDLGETDRARILIDQLAALSGSDPSEPDTHERRNRLLKRMVVANLGRDGLSHEAMVAVLDEFAADPLLGPEDRAWLIARQAELRLDEGEAEEAVDHLLVDMRRLERDDEIVDARTWGEMYTLLARGYFDQGRFDDAQFHLQQAMDRLDRRDPVRGDALLLQGRIDVARGELEDAHECLDEVAGQYRGTRAELPALLARAHVHGVLGDHEAGLADYRAVLKALSVTEPRRDVTSLSVAANLADRHDAAIATGDLPRALEYVTLAEDLFDSGEVPTDVLFRIASTSRQIADNMIADALASLAGGSPRLDMIDPVLRHQASRIHEQAGDYFLRYARAQAVEMGADESWAESLWLAGDSYDLAGRRRLAIEHFIEYRAGRPVDDPRQAEVTFRLAQAYQAEMEYEDAARCYEQVIEEHPRSPFGTGAHVPLARCYLALDRRPDAERQLLDVVENRQGQRSPITPKAMDYRNALFELGGFYYESGRYKEAIERLSTAEQRYGDDERINEVRFQLADSYRRRALELKEETEAAPNTPSADDPGRDSLVRENLEAALELFGRVCAGYAERDEQRLDRLQRDCLRYAWMYRGDCAMAQGRYEEAAALYDQAARRYAGHHASMHALVQICNCFHFLGDTVRAEAAHRRALDRLARLPDEAFEDEDALMDRAAWEQWLKSRPVGLVQGSGPRPPE